MSNPDSTMISQFEIPLAIEDKAQIYALVDPRTSEIRYVGKSTNPYKRLDGHMRDSVLRRYQDPRTCWLKALKLLGLTPSIVILECVDESEWEACERKWIAHFRAAGTRLTNTLDGGEGRSKGCRKSAESIEKTASKLRGRKRPPEVGAKISAARMGIRRTPEHRQKCRDGLVAWWNGMSPENQTSKMSKLWKSSKERAQKDNTSGQVGVSWSKERNKWVAYINTNGKRFPLGRFDTFEEAVAARQSAEVAYNITNPESPTLCRNLTWQLQ